MSLVTLPADIGVIPLGKRDFLDIVRKKGNQIAECPFLFFTIRRPKGDFRILLKADFTAPAYLHDNAGPSTNSG